MTAPRISQLIKQGRLDGVVVRKGRRVFLTSAQAADEALAVTSRGVPPAPAPAPPATSRKTARRSKASAPDQMSRAEAIRLKAEHDAHAAEQKLRKLKLENEHAAGKLIAVADAERQVDTWTARVVSMIAAIPSRIAQAGVPAAGVAIAQREINRIREEIAE